MRQVLCVSTVASLLNIADWKKSTAPGNSPVPPDLMSSIGDRDRVSRIRKAVGPDVAHLTLLGACAGG
jgi:hypothetical protein